MQIGSCISKKGEVRSGFIKVSFKGKSAKIPIKIIEGDSTKKVCFISAGMHGDELNGINVVSKYAAKINPRLLHGTVILVPILNPIGFHYGERRVRYDNKDLNRCFNRPVDSISSKLAKVFFEEIVSISDFGIDLHDSNKRYILLPHSRIFNNEYKDVDELSRVFGAEIVMKRKPKRGMLALESKKKYNIPVLTVEIGGGMNITPQYFNDGVRGLNSVLAHKGFIDGEITLPEKQFILSERFGYRSKIEGILITNKKLGDIVEKGEVVGRVFSPVSGKSLELSAKNHGILFSIKANSHIKANERAFSMLHVIKKGNEIIPTEGQMVLNRESSRVQVYAGVFNNAFDALRKHSKDFFKAIFKE